MKKLVVTVLSVCIAVALTACTISKNGSAEESSVPVEKKVDRQVVYDWLLKNGELTNGTELKYTVTSNDGSTLLVIADASKEIDVHYEFKDGKGYYISCKTRLFADGPKGDFWCKIVDDTTTGAVRTYSFEIAAFTQNSPVLDEQHVEFFIDGSSYESILVEEGKLKIIKYTLDSVEPVYKEIPDDRCKALMNIKNSFAENAQKSLCHMLEAIDHDFCSVLGITIHDLGYQSFEIQQDENGQNKTIVDSML